MKIGRFRVEVGLLAHNVISLCDVANFGNEYFQLPKTVMRTVNVNLIQNLQ